MKNDYMKKKSLFKNGLTGLPVVLLLFSVLTASAQSRYIKRYQPIADSLSEVYGIPTSVMLGIAIIESGAGSSRNCKLLNNHFGIKGKNDVFHCSKFLLEQKSGLPKTGLGRKKTFLPEL